MGLTRASPSRTSICTFSAGVGWHGLRVSGALGQSALPLLFRELFRQSQRSNHAALISDALACNVVSRPVIGRGADKRQAERPVYAALEPDHLQRHQSLIVIHRHNGIVLAAENVVEQSIGVEWTVNVAALFFRPARRGLDDGQSFGAALAAFDGMRIRAANSDARPGQSKVGTRLGGIRYGVKDLWLGQVRSHVLDREMRGREG